MSVDDIAYNEPQEIAVIDLGSNSFHLIIARIVSDSLQIVGHLKQRIHLADGLDKNNQLSEDAINRGLACLSLFAERLNGFSINNVRIVATHSLRVATNSDQFLQRAAKIMPYPIEIISGQEEARLIYMGVAHTEPSNNRKLVIDIGGGSTELVIGDGFSPIQGESRPIGCVNYSQLFFPNREISKKAFKAALSAAKQQFQTLPYHYKNKNWQLTLGASGTIKSIHNMLIALGEKNGIITTERLTLIIEHILQFKHFDEIDLPGLSFDRREIIVAGLAILAALFHCLKIKELDLSNGALREGVLYEMEGRFRHQDIRERTTNSLMKNYNIDQAQANRVWSTTKQLYLQWEKQNQELANPELKALLKWSAMLHEIGLSINYHHLQRHSAYILQHSNLPGFNREHQSILATLVFCQRKSIKLDELPLFSLFKKKQFIPLIQLFRLAILLNNQRQSTTPPNSISLLSDDNHVTLIFPTDYLEINSLLNTDLEREQAYWDDVVGWKLTLSTEAELTEKKQ